VHSTGAIIVRRWILNRILYNRTVPATAKRLPSHFVSLAGANHGSTLAQLGVTIVNRIRQDVQGADGVGQQVLSDLDYESAFLRRLNSEWIDAIASGELSAVFCFSMIGDDHSDFSDQLFWQTKENGCDSTVRICGANLNYSWLVADPDENQPLFRSRATGVEVPHLVLPGFSHTGAKGIIDSVRTERDAPFSALLEAFAVTDPASYQALLRKVARRDRCVECRSSRRLQLSFDLSIDRRERSRHHRQFDPPCRLFERCGQRDPVAAVAPAHPKLGRRFGDLVLREERRVHGDSAA
jgi:hypothetical protein